MLFRSNAKILGVIFNGVDPKQPEYGYYKYTEYYYSKTVSRKKTPEGGGETPGAELARGVEGATPHAEGRPLPPPPVPPASGKA